MFFLDLQVETLQVQLRTNQQVEKLRTLLNPLDLKAEELLQVAKTSQQLILWNLLLCRLCMKALD